MPFRRYPELNGAASSARARAGADAFTPAGLPILAVGAPALPVLWDGFVFVYHDSIDYLGLTFPWQLPEYRTAA